MTKTVPVQIGSKTFNVTTDDTYLDSMGGVFEPETVALFRTLVRADDLALDIGANIGMTALLLSQLARQVVCFEPSPTTCGFLRQNIAGLANVEAVNAGLGKEPADLKLVYAPANRSGGFVSSAQVAGHAFEPIRIENGDAQLAGRAVGFVKIDVEGFELQVLEGLRETLDRCRPVVTLEMNHWCLNVFQRTSIPDFLDALRATFPVLYAVHNGEALDLHEPANDYLVMYSHVVKFEYCALVGAFRPEQLTDFLARYVWKTPRYLRLEARNAELEERAAAVERHSAQLQQRISALEAAVVAESQKLQPWPVATRSLLTRAGRKLMRALG